MRTARPPAGLVEIQPAYSRLLSSHHRKRFYERLPVLTQPLFEHLDDVKRALIGAKRILLLLDFDGTLAPIVEKPELAKLPEQTSALLLALNAEPRVSIAVISGRSLADLRERIGLELIFAGNHGFEIEGPGLTFHPPDLTGTRLLMLTLANDLSHQLAKIDGVLIENKGPTLSVHYRKVNVKMVATILGTVASVFTPYSRLLELHEGKKVLEIRPRVEWNKGKAAQWILEHVEDGRVIAVCIGDDTTDEDIFRSLPGSISIKVGKEDTAARYRISTPEEVRFFLQEILTVVQNTGCTGSRGTALQSS